MLQNQTRVHWSESRQTRCRCPFPTGQSRSARVGFTRDSSWVEVRFNPYVCVVEPSGHRGCLEIFAPFLPGIFHSAIPSAALTSHIHHSNTRRDPAMTFQIFVGGQRVNSSDVLNQAAWSGKVRATEVFAPVTSKLGGGGFPLIF